MHMPGDDAVTLPLYRQALKLFLIFSDYCVSAVPIL